MSDQAGMLAINVKSNKALAVGMFGEFEGKFDFGKDLDEAVKRFGKDVIYNLASRMVSTDISNKLRAGMNPSEIEDKATGEKTIDKTSGMSEEECIATFVTRPMVACC